MNPPETSETPAQRPVPIAGDLPVSAPSRATLDAVMHDFAREYLKDRRSERRWRIVWRTLWFFILAGAAWWLFAGRNHVATPSGPHTALVEVRGEISDESPASAEHLVAALKAAFEDPGSQAVVLRFNSPGGSPVQAGIVHDEIVRLKALHKKKVYAVVEEVCASGAYYIAVAADEIYTDKASVVGSIGVLMDSFDFSGLLNRYGVQRRLLTAGENKGVGDPFSPLTDKQRGFLQATLDQIHRQFIKVVRDGRGARLKETPETFSGLFWNGEEAVRLGLVDKFGTLDFVAREVVKAEEVIDYTPRENIAERLAKRFGASVGAGAMTTLRGATGWR